MFGDFSVTGCRLKSTYWTAASFQPRLACVWRGVGRPNLHLILFLHCDIFGSLGQHVRSWIGVSGAVPQSLCAHFIQFTNYLRGSKARRSFLQLLWLLCVWLVWNERNNMLFKNVQTPITKLSDKVKYHSYWWLKVIKPLLCMVVRDDGQTRCYAWVSADLWFCNYLNDCL